MEQLILADPSSFSANFWIGGSHSKSWSLTLDDYRTFPAGKNKQQWSYLQC